MEYPEALEILRDLSDGIDPNTKRPLPADSICQRASIVRALCTAVSVLSSRERTRSRKLRLPSNAGKAWSKEEDAEICEEFGRAENMFSIASEHNRTVGSIAARLVKLNKLSPDELPRFVGPAKAARITDYETARKADNHNNVASREDDLRRFG